MEAIIDRVGGVDLGQATVVATVLVGAAHERPGKATRSFRTLTRELLTMRDWFVAEGVTHVALESTGVYWKPVHALLEDTFEVIVGNAHHIKNVPGRKTDVKDSEWLAQLARHGLIAKSFVPAKPLRQLRAVADDGHMGGDDGLGLRIRYRRQLPVQRQAP